MANRVVDEQDAIEWCKVNAGSGPVVTSPPDADEVGLQPSEWQAWFRAAVVACLDLAGDHPCIFYVTDRRAGGRLWSKAEIVLEEASWHETGTRRVLWHKIALRRQVNAVDLRRPSYTHLIAVGGSRCRPGVATPDVFERGLTLYPNGMGVRAASRAVAYLKLQGYSEVWNPFSGMGTVLAVAEAYGMDSYGCDIDPAMVEDSKLTKFHVSEVLA